MSLGGIVYVMIYLTIRTTQSLLSILKHRTVEKTVDRCELSIVEGVLPTQHADQDENDEDRDSLESRLIVRLHCKHGEGDQLAQPQISSNMTVGVVKTHRLLLLTPISLLAPSIPDGSNESRLTIGPKAVKDMIEHFPFAKGGKSDPQLIWSFGDSEVQLKSCETSIDSKGQLSIVGSYILDSPDLIRKSRQITTIYRIDYQCRRIRSL
jgi:cell cycle checkpoint control protein RAD9A